LGPPRGYIARTPGLLSAVQLSEVKWIGWLVREMEFSCGIFAEQ
jgi:hypothetical protein